MDAPDWPDSDALGGLVRRLADDPAAHADFVAAVYGPLLRDLQAAHPAEDPARVADVVGDLVLAFVKRPEPYDPTRLPVRAHLKMAVTGDLLYARAKDCRRAGREIPLDAVAEPAAGGNEEGEGDIRAWLADPRVAAVIDGFDDTERAVWALMLAGDQSTAACARLLGVADRPAAEQERAAKRVKDRIVRRLKRAREGGT
jgi:hypothetical protein